ncbi:hypothetical protein P7C70_g3970, partial [Phenoliferia sp. Uapishka_3]
MDPAVEKKSESMEPGQDVVGAGAADLEPPNYKSTTGKWELWSYYIYYIGNSGLGPFNFAPTYVAKLGVKSKNMLAYTLPLNHSQFQNLLALAGHNLDQPGVACDYTVACVLPFAGLAQRNVNSIVLLTNGVLGSPLLVHSTGALTLHASQISFAIQVVIFLVIGSVADYGTWRRYILVVFTAINFGLSFGWLGVEKPEQWQTATGLYIIGLIAYQGSLTFWTAAFPQLARNLPEMQDSQEKLIVGETTPEAHAKLDSFSRNRISNIAFTVCSCGELVVLAVLVGILFAVHSNASVENNTSALSIVSAYSGGVWVVCALPWFFLEKTRPGQPLPAGSNYVSTGINTIWNAMKEARKLTDTVIYLVFYFLMSDVLNTTVTVISTLQYALVSYNTLQLTYLLIVGIFTQAGESFLLPLLDPVADEPEILSVGIYAFWWFQKYFKLSTKTMFCIVVFWTMVLVGWGLVGAWTDKFGFKNVWEIWVYQAFYGLLATETYLFKSARGTHTLKL